jgi:hypothetical protein
MIYVIYRMPSMLIDIDQDEQDILLIALSNMQNVMLEIDKLNASTPEKIATALKEIDILKQKITA